MYGLPQWIKYIELVARVTLQAKVPRKVVEEQFLRALREEKAAAPGIGDDALGNGGAGVILSNRSAEAAGYAATHFLGEAAEMSALVRQRSEHDTILIRTTRAINDPTTANNTTTPTSATTTTGHGRYGSVSGTITATAQGTLPYLRIIYVINIGMTPVPFCTMRAPSNYLCQSHKLDDLWPAIPAFRVGSTM